MMGPRCRSLSDPTRKHSEILDLLELEDCGLAFADDCRSFALLGQQRHRPCHRRSQFHSAVIFQCNKLFRVYCHWYTLTLTAGLEASAHAPNAHSKSEPSVVNACLLDVSGMGFATRIALARRRGFGGNYDYGSCPYYTSY